MTDVGSSNLTLAGERRKPPLKSGQFEWTEKSEAELRQLWADGLPASDIQQEFGLKSRGAVLGKVHRLGLTPRIRTHGSAPKRGSSKRAIAIKAEPESAVVMPLGRITLDQLEDDVCHFPVGDGPTYTFCGEPTSTAPYCASCTRIAYRIR